MSEEKYGSDKKFNINFGERSLLEQENVTFSNMSIIDQVKKLAWSEGCPVMNNVIKTIGPESARDRYTEIILANRIILSVAQQLNLNIFPFLKQGVRRRMDEPVGIHEATSVPASHLTEISAPNTPWGFSLPRILIEQFGKKDERNQERMQKGVQILKYSLKTADSPLELIAIFSEKVVEDNPLIKDQILRRAFSKGYLNEENTISLYKALMKEIKKHSPILYKRYMELSSKEKEEKGIAEL